MLFYNRNLAPDFILVSLPALKDARLAVLSRFRGMMNTLQLAPLSSFIKDVESGA
jgi:hypothetical protein